MRISDWSADVCSSDLLDLPTARYKGAGTQAKRRGTKCIAPRRPGGATGCDECLDQAETTFSDTVAETSSCSLTDTWCEPSALIGLPSTMVRLSTFSPEVSESALAMSATVTAPKRRPPSPARTGRLTAFASSLDRKSTSQNSSP